MLTTTDGTRVGGTLPLARCVGCYCRRLSRPLTAAAHPHLFVVGQHRSKSIGIIGDSHARNLCTVESPLYSDGYYL